MRGADQLQRDDEKEKIALLLCSQPAYTRGWISAHRARRSDFTKRSKRGESSPRLAPSEQLRVSPGWWWHMSITAEQLIFLESEPQEGIKAADYHGGGGQEERKLFEFRAGSGRQACGTTPLAGKGERVAFFPTARDARTPQQQNTFILSCGFSAALSYFLGAIF